MYYIGTQSSSFRSTIKGLTDDEQRQLSDVSSSDHPSCSSDAFSELDDSCLDCCKWENNQSPSKEFDRWITMSPSQKSRLNTDACSDYASVCNSADCDLNEYIPCTDNCLVDPSDLSSRTMNNSCIDPCFSRSCDARPCEAGADCSLGVDHVVSNFLIACSRGQLTCPQLQCCTDNHSYPAPHASSSTSHSYQEHNIYSSNYGSKSYASQPPFNSPASTAFNAPHSPRNVQQFSSQSPFPSHHQLQHYSPSWTNYGPGGASGPQTLHNSQTYMNSMPPINNQPPILCRWAGCSAAFWNPEQLVYHVNTAHLQPHGSHPHASTSIDNGLSCLWDNCDMWQIGMNSLSHDLSFNPDFSFDSLKSMFSNHVLHDHLGLPLQHNPAVIDPLLSNPMFSPPLQSTPSLVRTDEPDSSSSGTSPLETPPHLRYQTPSSKSSSPTPTPSVSDPPHDCSAIHHCQWKGCKRVFNSCTELTEHLTAQHVGSGQNRYHCYWQGCNRHGEQGFTSKQKILRHLQVCLSCCLVFRPTIHSHFNSRIQAIGLSSVRYVRRTSPKRQPCSNICVDIHKKVRTLPKFRYRNDI